MSDPQQKADAERYFPGCFILMVLGLAALILFLGYHLVGML